VRLSQVGWLPVVLALGLACVPFGLLTADRPKPANPAPAREFKPTTRVTIADGKWHINGKVTYPGAKAEGLLNVRMVNAVFEDANDVGADGATAAKLCVEGGASCREAAGVRPLVEKQRRTRRCT
jgi:hypothetical protein